MRRNDVFSVNAKSAENAAAAQSILENLLTNFLSKQIPITEDEVQLALAQFAAFNPPLPAAAPEIAAGKPEPNSKVEALENLSDPELKTRKAGLVGRTPRQKAYLHAILQHDMTFGLGPAGTGKTYLAVACAVDALERDLVKRIILTRPAVEAGERLGFLPGDLAQKVDPYLRPLYDALYDLLGYEKTQKLFERQVIEIAPLAYMRGRTLSHAFIILDEAQNTTREQMKMFLTRMGFGSKAVITGDLSQIDLPKNTPCGLKEAVKILSQVDSIAQVVFDARDVVRHPVVSKIVSAYEQHSHA